MTPSVLNKIITTNKNVNFRDPKENAQARKEVIAKCVACFEDEQEFLNEYLGYYHFDPNSEIFTIEKDDKTYKFAILPPSVQQEREILSKKMRNQLIEAEIEGFNYTKEIIKHPLADGINDRDFIQLFGDTVTSSKPELKGYAVVNKLSDKNVSPDVKQKVFDEFLKEKINLTEKLINFKNDEEFVEKYPKMRSALMGFVLDHVKDCFKNISGLDLDPATLEKYNAAKSHFQGQLDFIVAKAGYLSDPAYKYFDQSEFIKLGEFQSFDENVSNGCKHFRYSAEKVFTSQVLSGASSEISNFKFLPNETKLLKVMIGSGEVKEDSEFYDANGNKLSYKDANETLCSKKPIGIIDKDGNMKVIEQKNDFSIKINDIFDLKENYKMRYAHMLDILDKGTTRWNKSSSYYKNMRNILGKLSKGQGNEKELLDRLEENANDYMENYKNKTKISEIAYKRKRCVEEMKQELDEIKNSVKFGDILRNKKAILEENKTNINEEDFSLFPKDREHAEIGSNYRNHIIIDSEKYIEGSKEEIQNDSNSSIVESNKNDKDIINMDN